MSTAEKKEIKDILTLARDEKFLARIEGKKLVDELKEYKYVSQVEEKKKVTQLSILRNLVTLLDKHATSEKVAVAYLTQLERLIHAVYPARSTYKTNVSKLKKLLTNNDVVAAWTKVFKSDEEEIKQDKSSDEKRVDELNKYSSVVQVEEALSKLYQLSKKGENLSRVEAEVLLCYALGMRYKEPMLFDLKKLDMSNKKDIDHTQSYHKVPQDKWIKQIGVLKDRRQKDGKDSKEEDAIDKKKIVYKPILQMFTVDDCLLWQKIVRGDKQKNPPENKACNELAEEMLKDYISDVARNDKKENKDEKKEARVISKAKWIHFGRSFYANVSHYYYQNQESLINWIPTVLGHAGKTALVHYTRVKLITPSSQEQKEKINMNTQDIKKLEQEVFSIKDRAMKWFAEKKISKNAVSIDDVVADIGKVRRTHSAGWINDIDEKVAYLEEADIPVTNANLRKFGIGAEKAKEYMTLYKNKLTKNKAEEKKAEVKEDKKENKEVENKKADNIEKKMEEKKNPLHCYVCNETFKTSQGLAGHKRSAHHKEKESKQSEPKEVKQEPAKEGKQEAKTEAKADTKVEAKEEKTVLKCDVCGRHDFKSKGGLTRHKNTSHANEMKQQEEKTKKDKEEEKAKEEKERKDMEEAEKKTKEEKEKKDKEAAEKKAKEEKEQKEKEDKEKKDKEDKEQEQSEKKRGKRAEKKKPEKKQKETKEEKKTAAMRCVACDRSFETKAHYDTHNRMFKGHKYFCKICKRAFKTEHNLNTHNKAVHNTAKSRK